MAHDGAGAAPGQDDGSVCSADRHIPMLGSKKLQGLSFANARR
jgi:hypothetical protein